MKKIIKFFAALTLTAAIVFCMAAAVFAEPVNENASDEIETAVSQESEAESEIPTEEPTQEPTDEATESPTEAPTEISSESEAQDSTEYVQEQASETINNTNNIDDLPDAGENEFIVPTVVIEGATPQSATVAAGIISWLCVAVGIVVIIVILSGSRTSNYMNGGKQRYESGDIISGGKRRR